MRLISFLGFLLSKGLQPHSAGDDDDVPNDYQQATYYTLIVCVIMSWIHILFHLMAFESTGPFVLTLYIIVTKDVPYFFGFFSLIWLSLGCALTLLTKAGDRSISTNFAHLVQVCWTLIKVTVGFSDDFNVEFVPVGMEWFYDAVRTAYSIAVTIFMLNLLIAMMSNTYQEYSTNSHNILLMEKYNFICAEQRVSVRKRITPAVERDMRLYSSEETHELIYGIKDTSEKSGKQVNDKVRREVIKRWYFQLESYQDVWFTSEREKKEGGDSVDQKPGASTVASNKDGGSKGGGFSTGGPDQKVALIIVDPQVDFHRGGSLAVAGADEDAERIAAFIDKHALRIDEIYITLDSHPRWKRFLRPALNLLNALDTTSVTLYSGGAVGKAP